VLLVQSRAPFLALARYVSGCSLIDMDEPFVLRACNHLRSKQNMTCAIKSAGTGFEFTVIRRYPQPQPTGRTLLSVACTIEQLDVTENRHVGNHGRDDKEC